ncbi:hypothetical protein V1522DRAFT_409297 [Lipomyces starkeyi]
MTLGCVLPVLLTCVTSPMTNVTGNSEHRADSVLKCGQEGSLEPGLSLSGQRQADWCTAGSSSSSSTGGYEESLSRTLLNTSTLIRPPVRQCVLGYGHAGKN